MKKALFLTAALLMAPAMVRAESEACGCDVTKIVTANWKQFAAGFAVGAATTLRPTELASNAQSLLIAVDNSTALNVVGTQVVHSVDGKKGIANVTALVAFTLGRFAGAQVAALKPAAK